MKIKNTYIKLHYLLALIFLALLFFPACMLMLNYIYVDLGFFIAYYVLLMPILYIIYYILFLKKQINNKISIIYTSSFIIIDLLLIIYTYSVGLKILSHINF